MGAGVGWGGLPCEIEQMVHSIEYEGIYFNLVPIFPPQILSVML